MANILCVWEMGGNLGHLANLKPFVDSALAHKHKVTLAAKEIRHLDIFFKGYDIELFQAPYHFRQPSTRFNPLQSYSQLILQRFETESELASLFSAWQSIFKAVEPDVVVYDFSPSALISSLGQPWQKWVIGNGFFVPRCDLEYLGLFPGIRKTAANQKTLAAAEQLLLEQVNSVLLRKERPSINDPKEIYQQAHHELLLTPSELDHFGPRKGVEYLGIALKNTGTAPVWNQQGALKAFGYLAHFKGIEALFDELLRQDVNLCIYSRNLPPEIISKYPEIVFIAEPVHLARVAEEADFAITMGNFSTVTEFFLNGLPQLLIPMFQEQYYLSRRIMDAKKGVLMGLTMKDPAPPVTEIIKLSRNGKFPIDEDYRAAMTGKLLEQRLNELFSSI